VVVARRRLPAVRADQPVAVLDRGVVFAASGEARVEGVRRGQRQRDAEACCPGLVLVDADPGADAVAFEAVARGLESITPRLALERPGVLSFPARGAARYFGGDDALVAHVLGVLADPAVRIGVADGTFAARLAAQSAERSGLPSVVVEEGGTPAFLAPWPVAVLDDPELADVLTRLGLATLGAFAALPEGAVIARFGSEGLAAHRLARGVDEHPSALTVPPPDLVETAELDPPAERVDVAMFVGKTLADSLLARLGERGLVCTRVIVEAETEHGEQIARCWRHDGALTAHALAERIRWQLEAWLTQTSLTAGIALLRLVPDEVVPASGRQLGFWGGDPAAADRAARAFARVQALVGHAAVTTAVVQGGRTPSERIAWVPWGEPRDPRRPLSHPSLGEVPSWPGAVPAPAPALVFEVPPSAALLDAEGADVRVSGRGVASAPPARLQCDALSSGGGAVIAWAGPWVHDLRWWDPRARSRRALWQVVLDTGTACLVAVERNRATLEAIHD